MLHAERRGRERGRAAYLHNHSLTQMARTGASQDGRQAGFTADLDPARTQRVLEPWLSLLLSSACSFSLAPRQPQT